jgi:eukaryotic-like serine/threonine-protein kinase
VSSLITSTLASVSIVPGTVIGGDYRILSELAAGGMGEIYVAQQLSTGKNRALKLMKAELLLDATLLARFEQEARVSSLIRSDHIVEVVGAGMDPGTQRPWLAMELLEGETLASLLGRRGRLPPQEARVLFAQLCHGLGAAHAARIVHRDLKPENIFIARTQQLGVDFRVKILDFGIAKLFDGAKTNATGAMSLGTPRYMAPEQTGGQPITPATDVWALGLITFQVLTGYYYWRRASGGANESVMTLMREILFEQLIPASVRAREVHAEGCLPPGFDGWFSRCVAREPTMRFQDASAAHAALDPLLAIAPSSAQVPAGLAPAATSQSSRRGLAIGLAGGLVALGALGGGALWLFQSKKPTKRSTDTEETPRKKRKADRETDEDDEPAPPTSKPPPTPTPTLAPPPPPPAPVVDRSGSYRIVRGTNPGGSTYKGTARIVANGSGYRTSWSNGAVGATLEWDGLLAATWGPNPHAVAIYKIEGGKLLGTYLDGLEFRRNTHTLEGAPGLSGSYVMTQSSESDTGTVTIRENLQTFALEARLTNETLRGTGIRVGEHLAVGWSLPTARDGGVVVYRPSGSRLVGVWAPHGSSVQGTEELDR